MKSLKNDTTAESAYLHFTVLIILPQEVLKDTFQPHLKTLFLKKS